MEEPHPSWSTGRRQHGPQPVQLPLLSLGGQKAGSETQKPGPTSRQALSSRHRRSHSYTASCVASSAVVGWVLEA